MKRIASYLLILLMFACSSDSPKKEKKEFKKKMREIILKEGEEKAVATFTIEGMSCQEGCAAKIESTVSALNGVKSCQVNFEQKKAVVEFDQHKITEDQIVAEIQKINEEQYFVKEIDVEKTTINPEEKL